MYTDQPDFSFVSESKSDEVRVKQMWTFSKNDVEIMQFIMRIVYQSLVGYKYSVISKLYFITSASLFSVPNKCKIYINCLYYKKHVLLNPKKYIVCVWGGWLL